MVAAGDLDRDRQLGVVVLAPPTWPGRNSSNCRPRPSPAWLMSDSSASISALPGSCFSSCVTYSSTCSFCLRSSRRLTACASLAAVVGLAAPAPWSRSASSSSCASDSSRNQPTHDDRRPRRQRRSPASAAIGHWPGSFGFRPRNCDAALLEDASSGRRCGLRLGGHGVLRPAWPAPPAARRRRRRRRAAAAAASCGRLSVDAHREVEQALLLARSRLDVAALISTSSGLLEPCGAVGRVAQQLGDALVGLRDAGDGRRPGRPA